MSQLSFRQLSDERCPTGTLVAVGLLLAGRKRPAAGGPDPRPGSAISSPPTRAPQDPGLDVTGPRGHSSRATG